MRFCLLAWSIGWGAGARAQEDLIDRPPPPSFDDLEKDENQDGVPDGWYNARGMRLVDEGGATGPRFVRFSNDRPGRPTRLSRIFGVDGKKVEAVVLGLWIRGKDIASGDREGDDPMLVIDFLGAEIKHLRRGIMGPWNRTAGPNWTRVAQRIPVPPGAKDTIMTLGLIGATGVLDVDGVSIDLVRREEVSTTNLIRNGDFELGDFAPDGWQTTGEARRVSPGFRSDAGMLFERGRGRIMAGLGIPVAGFEGLQLNLAARYNGLRGADAAHAGFYFVDDYGLPVPGHERGDLLVWWSGSNPWRPVQAQIRVPQGASRAFLQIEKTDSAGTLEIDDVSVTTLPNPEAGSWFPYHITDDVDEWLPLTPTPAIEPDSALDFSFLLDQPRGEKGRVAVKDGRLRFPDGQRARFFGAALLPPAALQDPDRAAIMVDRLARSGLNLVRISDLDAAYGPNRSLLDDTRDDTQGFDSQALARLDRLIALLKSRGMHFALELQGSRRFRVNDKVAEFGRLGPGGGPSSVVDPAIEQIVLGTAQALLAHENPETKTALRDDPALAWVTLKGEVSLFNLIDGQRLPGIHAQQLQKEAARNAGKAGRRLWELLESAQASRMTRALRSQGLKAPIASISHWRREPEFVAACTAATLDLVDDRLFWMAPIGIAPDLRSSLLAGQADSLIGLAREKRKLDRPYVVGQWCNQTPGLWASPFEAADLMLGAYTACIEDWDALVRRGVFVFPTDWGDGPVGTVGGEDVFQIPQVLNGSPHVIALLPHAASLFHHGASLSRIANRSSQTKTARTNRRRGNSFWDPTNGRLIVDTPHTQVVAGWMSGEIATLSDVDIVFDNRHAVIAISSATTDPIATTKRLLVTAVAQVEPSDFTWIDEWRRRPADPGSPPFLREPVRARITLKRGGPWKAYALESSGKRAHPAPLKKRVEGEGLILEINSQSPSFHWELSSE